MIRAPVLGLLLFALSAFADDIRFTDSTVAENRDQGQKTFVTHAENDRETSQAVTVTSGGVQYNAGLLEPGEGATVTVVEQAGKGPVILFSRES